MMRGGEIFVPKIPSMKIIDLAHDHGARTCTHRIVGIRPGEKLHETMITEDDARSTVELDDRYVIEPAFAWWDRTTFEGRRAKRVADDFRYASDTNAEWLEPDAAAERCSTDMALALMAAPPFLPYGRQTIEDDDIAAVAAALRADYLTTGPTVEAFERAFAERVGAAHAVACTSGTAACTWPPWRSISRPGDWLIVPSLTFLATANAARYVGAEVAVRRRRSRHRPDDRSHA